MASRDFRAIASQFHTENRISLLSTEKVSLKIGFLNLGAIIIFVMNFRLIVENILKYGFLINFPNTYDFIARNWVLTLIGLSLSIPLLCSYYVEMNIRPKTKGKGKVRLIHIALVTLTLYVPVQLFWIVKPSQILGCFILMFVCMCVMKQISFAHVMSEAKEVHANLKDKELTKNLSTETLAAIEKYPNCFSFSHFVTFWFLPTMCFQFSYPRTERIRKRWLLKRIIEYIFAIIMMTIIIQQYIAPLILNTIPILEAPTMNYVQLLERHLKLALPNLYLWLIIFYSGFHLWCNIWAELFRYGDRNFYDEWWNSRTFEEYWRLWNKPVHNWLVRHLYQPLVSNGYSKTFSMLIVFTVSAIAHEYIIGGACTVFTFWSFLGMFMQIPAIISQNMFRKYLESTQIGNVTFWVSFCIVGQPLAVIVYSYLVYKSS